jgi:hypothetical protein
LIRWPVVKAGHVHHASIAPYILRERVSMLAELMRLEVELGLENNKLLLQAFLVDA